MFRVVFLSPGKIYFRWIFGRFPVKIERSPKSDQVKVSFEHFENTGMVIYHVPVYKPLDRDMSVTDGKLQTVQMLWLPGAR